MPFHLLIRAALRRVSSLEETFGQGEPPLDYRGLVRRAEQITARESDCRWVDIERYSNRQKTNMLIGGLQGKLVYEGELAEFLPLLRYCEVTHLGKQTAFGLGRGWGLDKQ
ncbi:MAG: CRISPR system precrRNA processing endoribonuclease RAMP protein Cas6 [Deltaproteobacteria bacterium]|nr:CRISPR system precrRNA processing endoribonuclease RAMP protein Cas6 [Deltaproteobacteria bacterium]